MAATVGTGVARVVGGPLSLKAALDLNWDDSQACTQGLRTVLDALDALEQWLERHPTTGDAAAQVRAQDVTEPVAVAPERRRGVSRERRISLEDDQMRHGRKSRSVRVDGYKAPCAA